MAGRPMTRRAALAAALLLAASAAGCSLPGSTPTGDARQPGALDGMPWEALAELSAAVAEAPDAASAEGVAAGAGIVGADGLISPSALKSFELADGTPCQARVVGLRHDVCAGGGHAGLTMQIRTPLALRGVVDGAAASGGWEACALRAWLNGDALDLLPAGLSALLRPARKASATPGGAVAKTADALWLPSEVELSGEQWVRENYAEPGPILAEGAPYRLFAERAGDPGALRAALVAPDGATGAWQAWWQRTVDPDGSGFLFRWSTGAHTVAIDCAPNFELGVVPCFCL